jgi:dTDP-4-dehydrorhamnose reductase
MNNKKILILGDGKLGFELRAQMAWNYISRKKDHIDFTDISTYSNILDDYDQIINCIAYTNTYDNERENHWNVNFKAVCDLVDCCNIKDKKLIHISTDYIYAGSNIDATEEDIPVHAKNWYSYTKLLADGYIQARSKNYLLIRTSFKPWPWPYDNAISTQIGNFDYTYKIANLIEHLINNNACGIFNVGTEKKTIYYLAQQSKSDVIISDKILDETMPTDISMNINKMQDFLNK